MNTLYEGTENILQKNKSNNLLKIMAGFYSEVDQIFRDCEMKIMKVFGQILMLSNDVNNDLDINKYQRENN